MPQESHSPEETKRIAGNFTKSLKPGDIIFLQGDLGSGKTTFVQGLAEALGVKDPITSPTFLICQSYDVPNNPEIKTLNHIDAYRLASPSDILSIGLDDYLKLPNPVTLIEWPENIEGSPLKPKFVVKFDHIDETARKIEIKKM